MKKSPLFLIIVLIAASCSSSGADDNKFNPETDWVEITVGNQLEIDNELSKLADIYLKNGENDDCDDDYLCLTPKDGSESRFFRNVIIKGNIVKLQITASALFEGIYNLDMSETKLEELFYSVIPAKAKWVALPKTLKDMNAAFAGCNYLEEMVIPESTETIHDYNFENLSNLKRVVVNAVTPPNILYASEITEGAKESYPKIYPSQTWKLIVPKGSKVAYQDHEWWSRFSSIDEK